MKTNMLSAIAFLFLAFTWTSDAVQVQEGNLSFSLEAVKQLQELIDSKAAEQRSPGLRTSTDVSVCADPALPEEFLPLCQQKGASMSLSRLGMVPMDVCEICAFAACTGC